MQSRSCLIFSASQARQVCKVCPSLLDSPSDSVSTNRLDLEMGGWWLEQVNINLLDIPASLYMSCRAFCQGKGGACLPRKLLMSWYRRIFGGLSPQLCSLGQCFRFCQWDQKWTQLHFKIRYSSSQDRIVTVYTLYPYMDDGLRTAPTHTQPRPLS